MIELRNIGLSHVAGGRGVVALDQIDLSLERGSFTTIVGRSGCGKTSLLRILSGLQRPTTGEIRFAGSRPRIGYVFQEPRLMRWLTVRENVGFGLVGRLPAAQIRTRVDAALAQIGLTGFAAAMPSQLSGGMAGRVGLARALVLAPDLLLMDEPFAALDAFTRHSMQRDLTRIWQGTGATVVLVTHDVEEAVLLGQEVIELVEGRVADRHAVDLPFPREATDPAVLIHRRAILERLMEIPTDLKEQLR